MNQHRAETARRGRAESSSPGETEERNYVT
jgi:hypothetical protein